MFDGTELLIERLTWPDIESALADGYRTCIIMAGSIEQHGPQLPLITDTVIGQELALRIAKNLGKTLVAPVIAIGISDHHMALSGSLTIASDTLIALIVQYGKNLISHGFTTVLILSSHGGNFEAVGKAAIHVQESVEPEPRVVAIDDFQAYFLEQNRPVTQWGRTPEQGGQHAGFAETAMMLALCPELVRLDRAEVGYLKPINKEALFARGGRYFSPTGVLGDPRGATAEYGELLLDHLATFLVDAIRQKLSGSGVTF